MACFTLEKPDKQLKVRRVFFSVRTLKVFRLPATSCGVNDKNRNKIDKQRFLSLLSLQHALPLSLSLFLLSVYSAQLANRVTQGRPAGSYNRHGPPLIIKSID